MQMLHERCRYCRQLLHQEFMMAFRVYENVVNAYMKLMEIMTGTSPIADQNLPTARDSVDPSVIHFERVYLHGHPTDCSITQPRQHTLASP